jgi:hypothetical protein
MKFATPPKKTLSESRNQMSEVKKSDVGMEARRGVAERKGGAELHALPFFICVFFFENETNQV